MRTPPAALLISAFTSYMLAVVAPFASTLAALYWFRAGDRQPQPTTRLAQFGRWKNLSLREAKRHPLYGSSGIMVSLLVGMMLNVPVRVAEYFAAMPPIPAVAPSWLSALHFAMTFDVVVFSSLYMIAFVAALRRVPLFPRLLGAIWACDLAMQVATAKLVVAAGPLPPAVSHALATHAGRQCEEGADQRRPVAALPAAVEAGEHYLPAPHPGLSAVGCSPRLICFS